MDRLRNEPVPGAAGDEELAELGERLRKAAELSVPVLLAPEDRMAEVRRRVRRNRRIRAVALVTPVLALATAVPLLLPVAGPAGPGPSPAASGQTPSGSPAATDEPALRTVPLNEGRTALQITAPVGWQIMFPRDPNGTQVPNGVYLSSEPATPGQDGPCVGTLTGDDLENRDQCLPVAELPPHRGVLVYWARYGQPALETTGAPQPRQVGPSDACRKIGGTTAFSRTYTTLPGTGGTLTGYACLAAPDDDVLSRAVAVLNSLRPRAVSH